MNTFSALVVRAESASHLFGFYVHVPFCSRRCGYCDFAAFAGLEHLVDDYVEAVTAEVADFFDGEAASLLEETTGTTVYLGGGTPSLLDSGSLAALLEPLLATEPLEVTIEANPDSVDPVKARELASIGITRVSLGAQSCDPNVLGYLDRSHDVDSLRAAVDALRSAGIFEVNLDLIYGSPPEDLSSWEHTLEQAVALEPTHLSCYALTVEKGTDLWRRVHACGDPAPDPDDQAAKMEIAHRYLDAKGYRRYEVSAWARPGHECMHNLLYWGCGRYRGFGSGAHSFDGSRRFWNPRHPATYIGEQKTGRLPAGVENVDEETRLFDHLALGLRRTVGIPWPVTDAPATEFTRTRRLMSVGLVELVEGRLCPTPRGLALLNEVVVSVFSDLIDDARAGVCALSLPRVGC